MKKIIAMVALVFSCMLAYAQTNGEVIVMNKAMFIKDVFDYEKSQDWKYKGNKPAIIDLYADWCGPCRMVAPIMKELAKEYADKIVVYKVNVDKEKELAALFNATSIPLFVFIPMNGEPQLFRGAADKATYKKAIDDFFTENRIVHNRKKKLLTTFTKRQVRSFCILFTQNTIGISFHSPPCSSITDSYPAFLKAHKASGRPLLIRSG